MSYRITPATTSLSCHARSNYTGYHLGTHEMVVFTDNSGIQVKWYCNADIHVTIYQDKWVTWLDYMASQMAEDRAVESTASGQPVVALVCK